MKPHPSSAWAAVLLSGLLFTAGKAVAGPFSYLSDSEAITAISSRTFNGYDHPRNADGTYRPETFVFGDGGQIVDSASELDMVGYQAGIIREYAHGHGTGRLIEGESMGGTVTADPSIDDLAFPTIARMIEAPLREDNYRPSRDPGRTKLLIMVFWGRAQGTRGITDGSAHDAIVAFNGQLMGFDQEPWLQAHNDWSTLFFGRTFQMHLLDNQNSWNLSALEADRYFVVLRAFDFQAAWRQKKLQLLWETRFSLSERGHWFNEELPVMAQAASHYFGQKSDGLVRTPLKDTNVEIGALRNVSDPDLDPGNTK